jgi:hypothetical protein
MKEDQQVERSLLPSPTHSNRYQIFNNLLQLLTSRTVARLLESDPAAQNRLAYPQPTAPVSSFEPSLYAIVCVSRTVASHRFNAFAASFLGWLFVGLIIAKGKQQRGSSEGEAAKESYHVHLQLTPSRAGFQPIQDLAVD